VDARWSTTDISLLYTRSGKMHRASATSTKMDVSRNPTRQSGETRQDEFIRRLTTSE
jgi:hypothetical protein